MLAINIGNIGRGYKSFLQNIIIRCQASSSAFMIHLCTWAAVLLEPFSSSLGYTQMIHILVYTFSILLYMKYFDIRSSLILKEVLEIVSTVYIGLLIC